MPSVIWALMACIVYTCPSSCFLSSSHQTNKVDVIILKLHKRKLRLFVFKYIRANELQNMDFFIPYLVLNLVYQAVGCKENGFFKSSLATIFSLSGFNFEVNISECES